MPWRLQRKTGAGWRLRLLVLRSSERHSYWSSRHSEIRCLLFIPKRVRARKLWWETTKKSWSRFSIMVVDAVSSYMASSVTGHDSGWHA